MHPKVKARKCCWCSPPTVVENGWASLVIFVMQPSPVFRASRYSTASTEPVPQVHPERNKNLGIYLLSPIQKTDPRHGACQSATAARGTPRISRRSGQAQSADRIVPRRIRTPEGANECNGNVRFGSKADIGQNPFGVHFWLRHCFGMCALAITAPHLAM